MKNKEVKVVGSCEIQVTAMATDPYLIKALEELEPGLSTCPMDLGTLRHRLGTDKNGNDMLELALTETPDVLDGATEQDTMKFAFTKRINLESGAVTDVFPRAEVTFVSGTFGT